MGERDTHSAQTVSPDGGFISLATRARMRDGEHTVNDIYPRTALMLAAASWRWLAALALGGPGPSRAQP
jgi:hypothetical protein